MLENMTTGEKVIAGATAVGIAALIFHKPTRNAVGLADRYKFTKKRFKKMKELNLTSSAKIKRNPNGKGYIITDGYRKMIVEKTK